MGRKKKSGPKKGFARRYEEGTIQYYKHEVKIYQYWEKFKKFREDVFVREYKSKSAQARQKKRQALYGDKGYLKYKEIETIEEFKQLFEPEYYRFHITSKNRGEYAYKSIVNLYRDISTEDASEIAQAIWIRVSENKINQARPESTQYMFNTDLLTWFNSLIGIKSIADLADLIYNRKEGYDQLMEIKNRYFPKDTNHEAFYV